MRRMTIRGIVATALLLVPHASNAGFGPVNETAVPVDQIISAPHQGFTTSRGVPLFVYSR
jgi:hypothetical protein